MGGIAVGIVLDYAIEAIRGEENSTAGTSITITTTTAVALTGPFDEKPRTGISGGGNAGSKTSVASKANHAAAKKGLISTKTRNLTTKGLRKVPYVGTAIGLAQLGDAINDRIESETAEEPTSEPEPEPKQEELERN